MIRKKLLVSNLLTFVFVIIAIYFLQNLVFFDTSNVYRSFSMSEYTLIFGVLLLVLGITLYYEYKRLNKRPNWLFLVICAIAFLSNTIAVLMLPYEATTYNIVGTNGALYTFVVDVSMKDRLYNILCGFVMVCLTYFVFAIVPHRMYYRKQINFAFIALLILGFALIFYSWIAEWDKYIATLKMFVGGQFSYFDTPSAFFTSRNNYAFVLFLCILACFYLNVQKPRFYWYVIATFFYCNAFMTLCKTVIILAPIVLLVYLSSRFFLTYKEHKGRNIVVGSIIFILFTAFVIISLVSVYGNFERLNPLRFFYKDFVWDVGKTSMNARFRIWTYTWDILFSTNNVFGIGINGIEPLLYDLSYTETGSQVMRNSWFTHNGLLQTFSYGGVIMLLLVFIVVIYLIYVMIKTYRHDRALVSYSAIMMLTCLVYMFIEAAEVVFVTSAEYLGLMMMIVLPLLSRYYQAYKPHHMREIVYINEHINSYPRVPRPSLYKSRVILSVSIIVLSSVLGVMIYCGSSLHYNLLIPLIVIGIIIAICVFAMPFILRYFAEKRRKTPTSYQELLMELIIPNLALALITFFTSTVFSYAFNASNSALQILIPIVITLSFTILISVIPSLSYLFGYEYLLETLNDFYIYNFAYDIEQDDLYEPIKRGQKKNVAFVYSRNRSRFANQVINALPYKTVYLITNDLKLTRYEKVQLRRYHKVTTPNTIMKMEDVLSVSLDYDLASFIVIGGDIIDKKSLKELKEVHPHMTLTYLAYKNNYQSNSYLKMFDKAYIVDAKDDSKTKANLTKIKLNDIKSRIF